MLAGLAYGSAVPEQWASADADVDFYDVKGDIERLFAPQTVRFETFAHVAAHPGRCAQLLVDGRSVGWLGQMHPRLQQAYDLPKAPMLFEIEAEAVFARRVPVAADVSKLPMVTRDLALIVAREVSAQHIFDAFVKFIALEPTAYIIRDVQLFDIYQGEHVAATEKSMAYRVNLQDMSATLQDAQIDALMQAALAHLHSEVGARLR